MLGVVFTGGEGPAPEAAGRIIKGKGALVIAADSGLQAAEDALARPDWIVGDMDSLDSPSRLEKYPHEIVLRYGRDKDFTDTELAFSLALEKGAASVWIIGGGGGRTDHLFGIRSLFERDIFPSRWVTAREDIFCVDSKAGGGGKKLEIYTGAGAAVSVFPLGQGPWQARSEGLKWPLDGLSWNRGFFGLSNVATGLKISVEAARGRFMVIAPLPQGDQTGEAYERPRT